ncbi:uncharacterized protein [Onthophagus taurus]|uniref:uncharacterized protein n=1 Tax=Onthophagus taurus TaxID=166361 RepID=UPI000C2092F8|nr:uncharacterized protein LOC111418106 [Onthophagus taurus]
MIEIKKFICGLSLKHGTIIIGVVQSIASFMFLALSAAYAENPHELVDMSDPSLIPAQKVVLRAILICIATGSALHCAFSILLIFGAETNRPYLLLPWLIINPITVLAYVICAFVAVIYYTGPSQIIFFITQVVITLLLAFTLGYKILVVQNFYKFLKSLNF